MSISRSDVEKVAKLARLRFDGERLDSFADQMSKIVDFVDQLSEVNTDGIEPMAHPLDVQSVLRSDSLEPGLSRDEALRNSPNQDGEHFLVPPVLGPK